MSQIYPIHPFPARMAPSIVWDNLPNDGRPLRILDPMAGSGTTLVIARAIGHQVAGCDIDPLAVLIAHAWCTDISSDLLIEHAKKILNDAKEIAKNITPETAYPINADDVTKQFIDFWFDNNNRIQLTALSQCISNSEYTEEKNLLWTAFSRLIITKKLGASLAMDVSHSRPHRKYESAPIIPFEKFLPAVDYIIKKSPFRDKKTQANPAFITKGDARSLSFKNKSFDMVITSPPYLNAIDYIRGHKLSLVWMGYSISSLKSVSTNNVGTEHSRPFAVNEEFSNTLNKMGNIEKLSMHHQNMIVRYLDDISNILAECRRVLINNGQAIFVIGNSAIRGVQIKNSEALTYLAQNRGFKLSSTISRPISESRRYLPPPNSKSAGEKMNNRMREEVILHFIAI